MMKLSLNTHPSFPMAINVKNYCKTAKETPTMKHFLASMFVITALIFSQVASGQTTLINPAGDGGFENGATPGLNNWTAINSSIDSWIVGTGAGVSAGTNAAYISSTPAGAMDWTYSQLSTIQHLYYDVTIPAGESKVTLQFKWKAEGEGTTTSDWDNMKVFWGLASGISPSANTAISSTFQVSGPNAISGMYKLNSAAYNAETIVFSGVPGSTYRLVFSWKSDVSTIVNPPAAIDEVSLVSSVPGNYTSVATGDWTNPATWGTADFPTPVDNATISTGHTVTINALNLGANNLTVDGTLNFNTTATTMIVNGDLTVNTGGVFNVFNSTTGKRLNLFGNLTNNGTIDLSIGASSTTTNGVLNLTGSSVQTVGGTGTFTGSAIRNLLFTNTSTSIPNINWNFNNLTVLHQLNVTGARIDLNGNSIQIGNSTSTSPTLTSPGGTGFLDGTFSRWWTTTATGSAFTAGSNPTTTTSQYPFVDATGTNRSMWIRRTSSTSTGNTAGVVSVQYTDGTGMSNIPSVDDGGYMINRQYNGTWTITTDGVYVYVSGTHQIATVAPNAYFPVTTESRLMYMSSVVGTHEPGTITPGAKRFALATADLTGGSWYMGINNGDLPVTTVANGNWNSGATWSTGMVPTCNDAVLILHQVTINSAGNVAKGVTIQTGGVLTMTGGDLIVDACTPRADAKFDIGAGTFDMQGGTLTVNGSFRTLDTSTGVFKQSGGTIIVDGNNGVASESVASHIVDFYCNNLNHLQLTGGTFIVVDPPASTTTTNCAFKVFPSSTAGFAASSGSSWNLTFGNGTQTNNGGHANGYLINLNNTNSFKIGRAITIDAPIGSGSNRHVSSNAASPYTTPIGGLIINNGSEFRIPTSGNAVVNGDITNNGTMTAIGTLIFADWAAATQVTATVPATIDGGGVFQNSATTPSANLAAMKVNNSGGLSFNVPLTMSGTLLMTKGIINTTATNTLRLGTITAAGTLSTSSVFGNDTHINGPFLRTFGTTTATNTFTNIHLWPVGKSGKYQPIWLSPTTTAAGTIFTGEAFDSNSGSAGPGVTNLSNSTWSIIPNTAANLTNVHVQLSDAGITPSNLILQAPSSNGAYSGIVTGTLYSAGPPITLKTNPNGSPIPAASFTGYFAYGDLPSCTTPTAQPTSLMFSAVSTTSLTGMFTAAAPAPDGYLVVRYLSPSTPTDPVNTTQYAVNGALGAGTVVAVGPATTFNQTGLTANTAYDYYVYSFNNIGCGGGPLYLTTAPLFGTVTTCNTPAVAPPTALGTTGRTQTTITITWTASTTPGATYEVDVATDATFTNILQFAIPVAAAPYTIMGLSPGTTYHFRVRSFDGACYSTNVASSNGTLCTATTVPYIENLNSAISCLSVISTGTGNNWSVGAAPTTPSGMSGNTARIASSTSAATNNYFITQAITLTGGTSYDFKFKYGNTTTSATLSLDLFYSAADPGNGGIVLGNNVLISTLSNINNTAAQTITASFIPPSSGDYYLMLRAFGPTAGTASTVHVDDIEVIATPQCSAANGGTITSTVTGSACGNTSSTSLAATGYSTGLGISYQWQRSNDNFMSNVLDISGANDPLSAVATLLPGDNYFRLKVECSFGSLVGYSNVIGPIAYSNPAILTTTPGSRCGQGTVTLGATATPGDGISWYAAATGGAPLGTGTSFTTPVINATTTYYAAASNTGSPISGGRLTNLTSGDALSNVPRGVIFTTTSSHTINSLGFLCTGPAATLTVALYNSDGTTLLQSTSVSIPANSGTSATPVLVEQPVSLNVPSAGTYRLFVTAFDVSSSQLYYEFSGVTGYPYAVGGEMSITSSVTSLTGSASTTTYYYFYKITATPSCEGTRTPVTATVTPPPALTLSAASSTICQGTPSSLVTVTSTVGDYDTYTWNPASGVSGTPGAGYTFNPGTSTNYTLTAMQTGGQMCANTATHNVTVNPVPAVVATATPEVICSGDNSQLNITTTGLPGAIIISEVTLFRTGTGATSPYPAYATGADLVEISNTTSVPADISGWTLEDFGDNATTATHPGFAFPSGTIIPANSVAIVCLGTGTNDPANRYFNTGGTSDFWSSGGLVGIVLKNGSTVIDAVGLNSGYDFNPATGVTAGDWSGFAPSASGFAGTIRTAANDTDTGADWTQSSAGTPQTIGTYNGGYAPGGSIASYAWSPATFLSATNIANPLATAVTATTTYSVVVTTDQGCTATSNSVTVTVATGASITTHPVAQAKCVGSDVTFNVVATGPNLTYQWRKGGIDLNNGGSISGATTATLIITGVVAGDAGNYDVVVTSTCGSPVTSNQAALSVETTIPVAGITPPSATLCAGGSEMLTASGAGTGGTYTWSPATGLSATTGATVTASPTVTTTYTVVATNSGGCSDSETVTVTVNPVPVIATGSPTAIPNSICIGGTSNLNVNVGGLATLNGSSIAINESGNATPYPGNIAVSGVSGNVIGLKVTITNLSHTWPNDIDVVLFGPSGAHSVIFTDAIGGSGGISGVTYTFQAGATPLPTTGFPASGTYDVVNGGSYGGTGTPSAVTNTGLGVFNGTDPNGTWSLYVFDDASGDGGSIESWSLEITTGAPVTTYAWLPVTYLNDPTIANPTASGIMGTTTYTVTVSSATGCTATGSVEVSVNAFDWANLQFPAATTICEGTTFDAYGQVYEPGLTEAAGAVAGIVAEFGISPVGQNTNPSTWTNWTTAPFNVQVGNNDEYWITTGSSLAPGTYYYAFRYSYPNCTGVWQYGGYSAGGGGFWDGTTYVSGVLTVQAGIAWYLDADGDGYYTGSPVTSCTSPGAGYVTTVMGPGDCNDTNANINPGAPEICNNMADDDCDGTTDESVITFTGSGDWTNGANWDNNGAVPQTCNDIIIPAGKTVVLPAGANGVGRTLQVDVTAVFTVDPTAVLTILP